MTPTAATPSEEPAMLVVEPRYFGSIDHYARLARARRAVVATQGLFDKRRKDTHRCLIADGRGSTLRLTVPIAKPHGIDRARWADVGISTHDHWWTIHRESLATAYGRSPFFEFYIDRFMPFLSAGVEQRYPTLTDLCCAIDAELRRILLIDTEIVLQLPGDDPLPASPDTLFEPLPYYQTWAPPFIPHLSVLDLIFNLGPEAPLHLRTLAQSHQS